MIHLGSKLMYMVRPYVLTFLFYPFYGFLIFSSCYFLLILLFFIFKLFSSFCLFLFIILCPQTPVLPIAASQILSANNIKKKPRRKYNYIMSPAPPIATQPALSMRKPRKLSQFGKKSAKVYRSLYSSTEQLQVAL